jgi:hypothetical protein
LLEFVQKKKKKTSSCFAFQNSLHRGGAWMWVLFVNLSSVSWQNSVMTTYHDVNKVSNPSLNSYYMLVLHIIECLEEFTRLSWHVLQFVCALMFNYADHHIEAAFWLDVHVLKLVRVHCRVQPSSSSRLLEKWLSLQVRTRLNFSCTILVELRLVRMNTTLTLVPGLILTRVHIHLSY